jgi:hypothetical protein
MITGHRPNDRPEATGSDPCVTVEVYAFPAMKPEGAPVGQVHEIPGSVTPAFAHAAATFLFTHVAPGAWSRGIITKYRQTLTALAIRLAGSRVGQDLAALDTAAGAERLGEAFGEAFGQLAPATRVRHLSTLHSALAWWRTTGWITTDPTATWVRPKVAVDTTRAPSDRPRHCGIRHCGGCCMRPVLALPPPCLGIDGFVSAAWTPRGARVLALADQAGS